jgi:hypothetical protein
MRRRALLWMGGVALVVGVLLLTDWLLWEPGLTEDNVRRIRPVMPLAEVEALLGGPACPPTTRRIGGSGSGARAATSSWCGSSRMGG